MREDGPLDRSGIRGTNVLTLQVVHEVAREHAVQALEVDVETDLQVGQLVSGRGLESTARGRLMVVPGGQVAKHFE